MIPEPIVGKKYLGNPPFSQFTVTALGDVWIDVQHLGRFPGPGRIKRKHWAGRVVAYYIPAPVERIG